MKNTHNINAVIFGATGMIGRAVLLECLEDNRVESVVCIGRRPIDIQHPKLKVIVHQDFDTLHTLSGQVKGINTCFYAVGVSSAGMSEEKYTYLTYDLTINAAEMLLAHNRELTFCFVSGAGTDSSENGRTMWARVKGKTENALRAYPFTSLYCFRPGYIQPMKKIKSRVRMYRIMYFFSSPLYVVLKRFSSFVCSSVELGRAMINAAYHGSDKVILESKDIVALGRKHQGV